MLRMRIDDIIVGNDSGHLKLSPVEAQDLLRILLETLGPVPLTIRKDVYMVDPDKKRVSGMTSQWSQSGDLTGFLSIYSDSSKLVTTTNLTNVQLPSWSSR